MMEQEFLDYLDKHFFNIEIRRLDFKESIRVFRLHKHFKHDWKIFTITNYDKTPEGWPGKILKIEIFNSVIFPKANELTDDNKKNDNSFLNFVSEIDFFDLCLSQQDVSRKIV